MLKALLALDRCTDCMLNTGASQTADFTAGESLFHIRYHDIQFPDLVTLQRGGHKYTVIDDMGFDQWSYLMNPSDFYVHLDVSYKDTPFLISENIVHENGSVFLNLVVNKLILVAGKYTTSRTTYKIKIQRA